MTRRDTLSCVHEPFGDAFYYGPERLSPRFEEDVEARTDSGFNESTYKTIFDKMDEQGRREVRPFPSPCDNHGFSVVLSSLCFSSLPD